MSTLKILWVDDKIEELEFTVVKDLEAQFRERGLQTEISPYPSIAGVGDVIHRRGPFDLIVLDVQFDDKTNFTLADYPSIAGFATPVAIVSNHVLGENAYVDQYRPQIEQFRRISLGAFPKNREGVSRLAQVFSDYLKQPSVTAVVMSDLHLGQTISSTDELEARTAPLLADLQEMKLKHRPNHLLLLGDLITKGHVDDLPHVLTLITRMQGALDLQGRPGSLHLCPGNHDAILPEREPWSPVFERTVKHFAILDKALEDRFRDRMGRVRNFHQQKDLLAVGMGAQPGVLFAALGSTHLIPREDAPQSYEQAVPRVGETQLADLNTLVSQGEFGKIPLKIAMMHHPVFPSPSGDTVAEEPVLADAARVCRNLQELGFQLLLTGHSHYSCVHVHAMAALNTPAHASQPRHLAVVSVGTLGGDPNSATPARQYVVLRIGHPSGGIREVSLTTRVYNPDTRRFCEGQSLEFRLGEETIRKIPSMNYSII